MNLLKFFLTMSLLSFLCVNILFTPKVEANNTNTIYALETNWQLKYPAQENKTMVNNENYAKEVLRLVNIERAKVNAKPLSLREDLCKAADIRAKELKQLFSHTRPDGSHFSTVLPNDIAPRKAGENAAAGNATPQEVVAQWMNSPGHRQNILDSSYHSLGVGYYYDSKSEYEHYWIQLFLQ